uniref:CSON006853 protein n=1 Tax=Culicoides sonorensis TaxID=179676 RepID=A0A336LWR6_CULSO
MNGSRTNWTSARLTIELFLDLMGTSADVALLMGCVNKDIKDLEFFSLIMFIIIVCYLLYYLVVFAVCQAVLVLLVAVLMIGVKTYYFLCGHSLTQNWKHRTSDENR